jgi:prepilin-type N-terminal cleavage/methylation domain-containing protein
MSRKSQSKRGGYTLMELLIVMSILAILYGIGSRLVAAGHRATEHVKKVNADHQSAVQKHVDDIDADSVAQDAPTPLNTLAAPAPAEAIPAASQGLQRQVAVQSEVPGAPPASVPSAPASGRGGFPSPSDRSALLAYAHRVVEENPQEGKPEPYVFEQNSGM